MKKLTFPSHLNIDKVGEVWRVPYQERAEEAERWAEKHSLRPAGDDKFRICLLLVDVQNTFCIPEFELFIAGRSGMGAVDDNRRLTEFIYRNLGVITQISPTMDTHQVIQIFHTIYLINDKGEHPSPFTLISEEDIKQGVWRFNPGIRRFLGVTEEYGQDYLFHYTHKLKESGRYDLTIWPYHAMRGGIGYALVSSIEEAIFFHSVARFSQPDFQIKGYHPFTENYSVLGPEVLEDQEGRAIARKNVSFIEKLLEFDRVIIAGQAKSHCVAWTVEDLLREIRLRDEKLAGKVYLLEDCTSPVVIPGVIDYTEEADATFRKFAEAGIHIVRSTDPINTWPNGPF